MKWIARILLIAFLPVASMAGSSAQAQLPKLKTPGQIVKDIEGINQQAKSVVIGQPVSQVASMDSIMSAIAKPFQDLADFISSDEDGAATLATQIPDLQDTNGRACWLKMKDAGAVFKAHPVPLTLKVVTDFEALRLLQMTANNLCSYTPCTVVFADGANLATAAASAAGGVFTISGIPSLTQLCSRIPQIAPMLPPSATGILPTPVPSPSPTVSIAPAATPSPTPAQ